MHPYREPDHFNKKTIEIETKDVFVNVIYLDENNKQITSICEFLGTPSATKVTGSIEPRIYHNDGINRFWSWKESVRKDNFVELQNQTIIPIHRLLKIKFETQTRIAAVEIVVNE